jgi:hypothetical protein
MIKKNGGSSLQAWSYYIFVVATQVVKKMLYVFGKNFAQMLRYGKK